MLVGLLIGLTVLAFSPVLKAELLFVQDDDEQVIDNQSIRDWSVVGAAKIFKGITLGMYQPLTTLSYLVEYRLAGLTPFIYHLDNLLLHLINAWLVYWLTHAIWGKRRVALATAVLFALWPTQVEPVAWVSARSTLLSSLFILLCLYLRLLGQKTNLKRYKFMSAGAFVLGLFSKSVAIALLPLIIITDWHQGKLNRKKTLEYLTLFLTVVVFGLAAIYARGVMFAETGNNIKHSPIHLAAISGVTFAWQAFKLVWPFNLSPFYQRLLDVFNTLPWWVYFTALSPLLAIGLAGLLKKSRVAVFFIGWFFFNIFFSIMIVPYLYQAGADRYNYLAVLSLIWPLVFVFEKGYQKSKLFVLAPVALILLFAWQNFNYAQIWQTDISLMTKAAAMAPGSVATWNNLAIAQMSHGDLFAALASIQKSLQMDPDKYEPLLNKGIIELNLAGGKPDLIKLAQNDLSAAANINPERPDPHFFMGLAEAQKGDYLMALKKFDQALLLAKDKPIKNDILLNRGLAFERLGKRQEACVDFKASGKDYDEQTKITCD